MATTSAPAEVQNRALLWIPYTLACALLVMALTQLLNFEAFALSITTFEITHPGQVTTLAIILIALEIFALPFLLRLWLSKLARATSAVLVLLAPLAWLSLMLQGVSRQLSVANTGIFGDILPLPLTPLTVLFTGALLSGAIWSFVILHGDRALH